MNWPGAIICMSSAVIAVTGVGEFMPSRVMREPVTVTSSTPAGPGLTSCAAATPAHSAPPTAIESLVRRSPLIVVVLFRFTVGLPVL